jgi:hypothetical protein
MRPTLPEGVDRVTSPELAELSSRVVIAKIRFNAQETVCTDDPKVTAPLRVQSITDVVPQPVREMSS